MCHGWKEKCVWCEEEYENGELEQNELGLLCNKCKRAIESRGELTRKINESREKTDTTLKTSFINKLSEAFAISGIAEKLEYSKTVIGEFVTITINDFCIKEINISRNSFEQIIIDIMKGLKGE